MARVLLDTNLLSELLRQRPDPEVLAWFERAQTNELCVSAVTQAEMLLGAELLPAGKRRDRLQAALRGMFDEDFANRVLPFDAAAARAFADIVAARQRAGRPISQFDAQIAATARTCLAALATRNTPDFDGLGLSLVNPWLPPD